MNQFPLYIESWIAYLILGLLLLFLLDLKLQRLRFAIRIALLSLIAVGAFTPQAVIDTNYYAPIILTSLLNAEVQGVDSIYHALLILLTVWGVVFALSLACRHLFLARKNNSEQQTDDANATKTKTEPKLEPHGLPNHKE